MAAADKCTLSVCVAFACSMGCGDDVAFTASTYGGEATGDADSSDGGDPTTVGEGPTEGGSADETGGGGGEGGGPPCGFEGMLGGPGDYALEVVPATPTPFTPRDDCVFPGIYDEFAGPDDFAMNDASTAFEVYVYHPQTETGEWPEGLADRPVVFFNPGNGYRLVQGEANFESSHRYLPMIRRLVEAGFVVFGIDYPALSTSVSSGHRRAAIACTMIWARDTWDASADRLSPYAVLSGHSRGGAAAFLLTEHIMSNTSLPEATSLDDWQQCALATLAQGYGATGGTFIDPITQSTAPPFLSVVGTIDEDTRTQGILAYDGRGPESPAGSLDAFDESVVVLHGHSHASMGGSSLLQRALPGFYVEQFLRWQMMGDDASRRRFMDLVDVEVDPCAFEDIPDADGSNWDGPLQPYYSGCQGPNPPTICSDPAAEDLQGMGRALIRADFGQGIQPVGADKLVIDTLDHETNACELHSTQGSDIASSSSGRRVRLAASTPVDEEGPCVCVATPELLLGGYAGVGAPTACDPPTANVFGTQGFTAHEGGAMLVNFGGDAGPASIQWSLAEGNDAGLPFSIADYTHISVRVGNIVTDPGAECDAAFIPDEFEITAEIEDTDAANSPSVLTLGTLVESDEAEVLLTNTLVCRSAHFMQTLRIPLRRYCAEGQFNPYDATAITLHFADPDRSHVALVDSIELVRDPDGAALVPTCSEEVLDACPSAAPSGWNCEATVNLAALETSCTTEPISGVCPTASIVSNEIDLPVVDEGDPAEFSGWVVNIPRGWLRDPLDPTAAEVDDITARCISACELEYADRPEIAANCSDSGAFATPSLRQTPDLGARVAIADARADGSGIFTGAALNCDLRDTCADAFDEDLAIARPRRPTSTGEPIHRGEEWLVNVSGDVYAYSPDAPNVVSVDLEGSIGFSHCAGGNASGPCPFYLGSLDLEMVDPLTIALECDGATEVHVLDSMTVRLAQPAFGIAPQNSQWRGFPAGALVFEADGVVDGEPFHAIGPADRDFKFIANNGWVQMQGAGGAYLELTMPCGEGTSEVLAWLGFNAVAWPGTPPSVQITVPSQVTCPSTRPLTKTVSDSQQDIVGVRWSVDGVLLDESVTSIPFTQAHSLQAVVRDSRGATHTKTKAVACR